MALLACSGGSPRAASAELDEEPPHPEADAGGFDPCALKGTGCPCADPGKVVECGTIKKQVGDYQLCSYGYRTCDETLLEWSECKPGPTLLIDDGDAGAPASE